MDVFRFNRAIVRRPGPEVVDGLRAGDQEGPSFGGVAAEHAAYVAALEEAGLAVTILDPLEDFPDGLFVEDPALVFPEAAILLRAAAPSRSGEGERLAPVLAQAFETLLALDEGFADGGDILVTPGEVLIGLSARTDRAGAEALARLLAGIGRKARIVAPPAGTLHLKSASSLVDEETIVATAPLAASGLFDGFRLIVVPQGEEAAANLLRLNDRILAGRDFPRTLDLLDAHGASVVPLANAEIGKIDAGLSCMSLRWLARQ